MAQPLPPDDSPYIWIQAEYLKRTSIEEAYVEVNKGIREARKRIVGFNPVLFPAEFLTSVGQKSKGEPPAKMSKPEKQESEESAETVDDEWNENLPSGGLEHDLDLVNDVDQSNYDLEIQSESDESLNDDDDLEEQYPLDDFDQFVQVPTPDLIDPGYSLEDIRQLYKYFAGKEFAETWGTTHKLSIQDFLKVLTIQRALGNYQIAKPYRPEMKKLKIRTETRGMTVEIYADSEEEEPIWIHYQFSEHATFVFDNGLARRYANKPHQEMCADDVFWLLQNKKLELKELEFEIEPYQRGGRRLYPQFNRFINELLFPKLYRLEHNIRTRKLFLRTCRGFNLCDIQLEIFLDSLKPTYLTTLELPLWDDSKMINKRLQLEKERENSRTYAYQCSHFATWKQAKRLIIEDEGVTKSWNGFTHFHVIQLVKFDPNELINCRKAFSAHPPTQMCTIYVKRRLKMELIKFRMLNGQDDEMIFEGVYKFPSADKAHTIVMKFYETKITIETTDMAWADCVAEQAELASALES